MTGQGTGSVSNRTVPADQSMCGLGRSTFRVGGKLSWLRAATILMIPATPAAAWVWPMLDLIDPSHSGRSAVTRGAVGGDQGAGLDRVAQRGAGAVGLDHIDLIEPDAGVGHGLGDDALLGGPVGGGQTVGGAVLVDRRSRDDRQHRMVVALGIAEPFQHQHRGPFAPAGAIGVGGERFTTPIGSQPALPGELGEHRRCGHHRDTTGQGQSRLAVAQRLTRQMRGHQR